MNLQELLAKKAELQAELKRVEDAIANYGNASAVKIATHKNIRNTPYLSVNLSRASEEGILVVYANKELSEPADNSWHEGWVPREAWTTFKLEHPDLINDLIWEAKS